MTLKDLERMNGLVSLSKLAKLFGYEYTRFHTRIKRGGPELTKHESDTILALLKKHGLRPLYPPPRLIAESPAMAEALEWCEHVLNGVLGDPDWKDEPDAIKAYEQIQQILARVRGEEGR